MPKKRKAAKKVAGPKCAICDAPMRLRKVIPQAWIFAELRTFQCAGCGCLRTVEDEAELATAEAARVAA